MASISNEESRKARLEKNAQSQFSTLYRGLEKTIPSQMAVDVKYEEERRVVMRALGILNIETKLKYNNPNEATQRSKHHGKFARNQAEQKRQVAICRDNAEAARKVREFKETMREADRMISLTKQMQKCIENKESIPPQLFDSLAALSPVRSKSNPNPPLGAGGVGVGGGVTDISVSSSRRQPLSPVYKELPSIATAKREPRVMVKTHTKHRWSLEERKLLNMLYLDIPRPQYNKKELWRFYYEQMSRRFQQFHPTRSLSDISEKIEDMLLKRQMKEVGELSYWEEKNAAKDEEEDEGRVGKWVP